MISWLGKEKTLVALNMTETKYVASCASSHEVVWLQNFLIGLFNIAMEVTCIL
jgi:hypothetical protein